MVTYEDCLYTDAQQILRLLKESSYPEGPVFLIFRSGWEVEPEHIMNMTTVCLQREGVSIFPRSVSISGIRIIDILLSDHPSTLFASVDILWFLYNRIQTIPIQVRKQLERLYQKKCSIITCVPKKFDLYSVSTELQEIGYTPLILDEPNDIQIDLPFHNEVEQRAEVKALIDDYQEMHTELASTDDRWDVICQPLKDSTPKIVFFPEKISYNAESPFVTYVGRIRVDCNENFSGVGWKEAKKMFCPHCMEYIVLGRDSPDNPFKYHPCFDISSDLRFEDETVFWEHVDQCPPSFSCDGIHEVKTNIQRQIAAKFSIFSKRECRWDAPTIAVHSFEDGARAFIFVECGIPVSYMAFHFREFDGVGTRYILWDLYTFPEFRHRGKSSCLLDHAIRTLNIDTDLFFISFPVQKEAKNIIMSRVGKEVVMIRPHHNERIEKGVLLENWEDCNDD